MYFFIFLKTEILEADVEKYDAVLQDYEEKLTIDNADYTEYIKNNYQPAKKTNSVKSLRNLQTQKLRNCLKNYKKESINIKEIISENTRLLNILNESTIELKQKYLPSEE